VANPSIAAGRRQEAATAILQPSVDAQGVNLGKLLVGAGRVDELDGIIEEYDRLTDEDTGRVRALATTAIPLTRSDADKLEASLTRRLDRQVRLDTRVE